MLKIYVLLMVIGVIVGLSHFSISRRTQNAAPAPPDSQAA